MFYAFNAFSNKEMSLIHISASRGKSAFKIWTAAKLSASLKPDVPFEFGSCHVQKDGCRTTSFQVVFQGRCA